MMEHFLFLENLIFILITNADAHRNSTESLFKVSKKTFFRTHLSMLKYSNSQQRWKHNVQSRLIVSLLGSKLLPLLKRKDFLQLQCFQPEALAKR